MDELEDIVQRMIDAGESEEDIKLVIENYENTSAETDTQDFPTAVATETAPVTADAIAEDTELALVDTSLESPEAVEVEDPLSSWQSIKNSFSNLGEQVGDVFEFWLDTEGEGGGARASLDIASNAVWSMMFGQESVDEYVKEKGKDSYMAKGVGSESTLKSIKKFEEEKLESKETKGVIESIKNGDIGGAFAGTINALTSAVGSVAFGVGTVGAGFLSEYVAENYVEFNKLKAKNLGVSVDELIKSGEADTAIPVGMGIISSSLEYVGIGAILKGVKGASKGTAGSGNLISKANKYLAAKTIYSKNARAVMNTLATGTTEFTTEILQHAADEVNKEFGSVAGTDKEAEVGKAFIDAITSQEGLEAGVQGFLGGGGLAAGSYSAKAMNTIRTITDARSIDKSLNALSSVRAKYNKSTDDVVKEGLQKEIDNKESEIADAVRNGNIIYENLTDGQISEIETLTDLADASAYKVTELNKKLRSGEISEETYNSAKSGFDTEYKSARQKLLDMQLDKNLEFAKEEGLKRGLEFEVYENQKDFNEAVLAVKNVSEESVKEFKDIKGRTHGTSIGNKILINKEFAREEGAINVGSHELLHPIFNKLIGDSKNQGKFVRQFKRSMTSSQRRFIDGEMKKRKYTGKQYNTEYMNVFSDALREKQINYDKTTFEKIGDAIVGLFKPRGYENISFDSGQDVYNFIKEYDQSADKGALTSKAEKALGDVDLSDAVLTSKQSDEVISKSKPFNELQDQLNELDVMDFDNEIEYDQAIANLESKIRLTKRKETLAKREVKKEVKEKVVTDKKIFDNEGLVETIKSKETTRKEKSNAETELLESFDALALKAIKYDTRKGDYDRTEIRDYLRQFLPGIIDRYDPSESKFSTYVTNTMAPKAQQTYERFRKIADRSLDVTAGELGSVKEIAAEQSTSTQETVKKPSRKIKPIELIRNLGLQKKYKDSVKKIVEGGKALVDGNTFGNLKDLAAEVTAEIFDIPLLKVTDPADNLAFKDVIVDASNISKIKVYYPDAKVGMVIKSESSKIQDIIKSMGPDLFKLLPPENVAPELATVDAQAYKSVKGTGLKIPSSLMKAFYEATGKRSKGVTSQVIIKKLKPGLTYEQFLKELGIVKGQPNTYDRAIGQRLKAITTLFGKLATNTEVRQLEGVTDVQVQNIAAGKSDIQFSNSQNLDKDFNDILEKKSGIASYKEYKRVKAEVVGASKGRFNFFIPPSAEDFVGLLYATLGKNKTGDAQMAWYKKNLLNPFARAMENVSRDRNSLGRDFKALKKTLKIVPKNLKKKLPGEPFTTEQAVRVWIWNQIGKDIPGLDDADVKTLVDYVNSRPDLQSFGTEIMKLNKGTAYTSPTDSWNTGTITTDLLETLNTTKRKEYLELWQQNVDIIFSEKNLNKLEAIYGKQYRKAMENILSRMKTGKNRFTGSDSLTTRVTDWLTGSIGAIMFFNTRSAVLQTLSAVNFINFGDNNILAAGKAFANQKQYWTDFKKLFNSEFLIERRDGLKMNVNEADIADIAKEKGVRGVINKLLKLGFTPTQLADSFAIASGGSTFYRNRLNALIKGGMNTQAAEKQAMSDFREIAEESQQSSRPDKISQQQAGPLGRIVLAFANTPAQYARLIKKAASDLKNGRGDAKTNISKIIYYGVAQNLIFNALQQALFAISFGEDEEEDEKKVVGIANGMADSLLRGIGIGGAIISTVKNAGLKLAKENAKKNPKYEEVAIELLKISPPVSSKISKVRAAGRSYSWDKKEMKEKGWSLDNPAYLANANIISAASNIPLDRVIKKIDNITASTGANLSFTQRVALLSGWSEWQLGIEKDDKKNKPKKGRTINKRVINKRVVNKRTIN